MLPHHCCPWIFSVDDFYVNVYNLSFLHAVNVGNVKLTQMSIYRQRVLEIVQAGLEESISFSELKMWKETSQLNASIFIALPACGKILLYTSICRIQQQCQNASQSHTVKMSVNFQLTVLYCHNTDLAYVNGHDWIILVIFSQALYKALRLWILCDPKHVGALLNIL